MEQDYFTGSLSLLSPNHSFWSCGGPETFTSTTIFLNVVEKLAWGGGGAGILHPENPTNIAKG